MRPNVLLFVSISLLLSSACSRNRSQPEGNGSATAPAPIDRKPTGFEDTTWGMSSAELRARYEREITTSTVGRFPGKHSPIILHRTLDGVPVEIAFHVRDHGLDMIEVVSLREYTDFEKTRIDEATVVEWIEKKVGSPKERTAGSATWITPTSKILVYSDEALSASYEPITTTDATVK